MNKIVKEILEKLEKEGFQAYIVGGYVRDFLLHISSTDYDICTSACAKDLKRLFNKNVNQYGSLNIKDKDINIDITTFRKEKNYHNRRPKTIAFVDSLEIDLLRRDFTINTLCMDKDEKIIDKLGGLKDLKQQKIRMVGNVRTKLQEDPLRILRAIRIATLLNFTLEETLKQEIILNKELLRTLSPYRIKEEISKILSSPYYKKGLSFLKDYHLCECLSLSYTNVVYTSSLVGMWAQIETKKTLDFTKKEKENIVKLQEILKMKVISKEVLFQYGLSLSLIAGEIMGISSYSIHNKYKEMAIHNRKDLHISYSEICELLNVMPSKKIKKIESHLIHEVLYNRLKNTEEDLKKYIIQNKERWFL